MTEIQSLEQEIMKMTDKLAALKKAAPLQEVKNYPLRDLNGETSLFELFAGKDKMFVIHNMGQGCRYCTLWADGLNGFLTHLENEFSVVLVSKDAPELQRTFANSRGWRYRMASHAGGEYIQDQSVSPGEKNIPGVVFYERKDDKIFKKNSAIFGPGDLYCSIWNLLGLAGRAESDWTPQYNYWQRPSKMDDGGANLL
ncbi:MAG: DUF899 family protein [Pseudobdellovibrionaceae bacterium]